MDPRAASVLIPENPLNPRVPSTVRGGAQVPGPDGRAPLPQGGFGILEEMCVNYVHYYPRTQLELCKSAVDPGFLREYFHTVNRCRSPSGSPGRRGGGSPTQAGLAPGEVRNPG